MNTKIKMIDENFGEINFLNGSGLTFKNDGVLLLMDDVVKILNIKKSKCMIFMKQEDIFLYNNEKYVAREGLNKLYNLSNADYVDEFKTLVTKYMQSIIEDSIVKTIKVEKETVKQDVKQDVKPTPKPMVKQIKNTKNNIQKVQKADEIYKELIKSVKNKMIHINYHGFTTNRMYEYCTQTGIRKRTLAYNKWRENFPVKQLDKMKNKVDFSKPILAIYSFKCKENFDTPNFSKALNDIICSYFGASDHFIRHEIVHTDSFVDKYENGRISIYLINID